MTAKEIKISKADIKKDEDQKNLQVEITGQVIIPELKL
jgi:hypothetical protein